MTTFKCGHPKSVENTGFSKDNRGSCPEGGYPYCRICHAAKAAKYKANRTPEQIEKDRATGRESAKRRNRKYRQEAIEAYGGKCVCCGEVTPAFLHLDHVNNDGAAHRRELNKGKERGSMALLSWAKRNNWPDTLQLKCHNCGMAEGFYGQCPHNTD